MAQQLSVRPELGIDRHFDYGAGRLHIDFDLAVAGDFQLQLRHGHAVQAHMQKKVLDQLYGFTTNGSAHDLENLDQLQRLAQRIGENRVVAGVHYPTDITEGEKLGDLLGAYFANVAKVGGTPLGWLWTRAKREI